MFCGVLALPAGMVSIIPLSPSDKVVIQDFSAGGGLVRWKVPVLPDTWF